MTPAASHSSLPVNRRLPWFLMATLIVVVACEPRAKVPAAIAMEARHVTRADGSSFPVLVWWPAAVRHGDTVRFLDAVLTESAPDAPSDTLRRRFASRFRESFGDSMTPRLDAVLRRSLGLRGTRDDARMTQHPLVIIIGSLNGQAYDHAALGAQLAAAGALAVSIPSGAAAGREPQTIGVTGVRTQLDDLRAVLHTASQWADVDSTRIALAAWSTGGLAAAMAAAERPNVVAFASLDGATAYAYGDSLLAEVAGSTWRWRTPYLHLVAGVTGPVAQSEHFLSLGCETVAWRSRVAGTQHRHFVSFHGALSPVTDTVATRGIQVWGETLLAFLSQRLQLSGRRALVADSLPLPPCPPSPVNPADARGTPHPA